ncbi:MAG: hypothetical protein NVS9B12_01730 [Vulcanimicrobiaceae bacterium]
MITPRAASLAAGVVLAVLALTFARPAPTPGPVMRDFESYYSAGAAWAAHFSPYSTDIWAFERKIPGVQERSAEVLPFVGVPSFLPLWAVFARAPYRIATIAWGSVLLLCAAAFAIVLLREADALSAGTLLAVCVLGAGFGPFTSDLALGQAALPAFCACVAATLMLARSYPLGIVWSFFGALQPNIAIVLLSQLTLRRGGAILAVALAVAAAVGTAVLGWRGVIAYVDGVFAHGSAERYALIQMTPAAIAYGFGIAPAICRIIGILSAATALIAGVRLVRHPYVKPVWKLAAACALLPFIVPFFHEHDFVVFLLPALYCATLCDGKDRTIAALGTMLVATDWLGLAQRPGGLTQSLLLSVAVLCALYALSEESWRRMLAPASVVFLVLVLGIIARNHPAPIWPDAMHAGGAVFGPVAQVWHEELQRSSQFALNPLWALLRALTLSGAGLVAWATLAAARRRDQLEIS